jgi:hypothetical protein
MRALRRVAGAMVLLLALAGLGLPALGLGLAVRPPPAWSTSLPARPTVVGSRLCLGPCWREEVGGLIHVHLAGSPGDLGWAQGVLAGDLIATLQGELMERFVTAAPTVAARHLILGLVAWNGRDLETRMAPREVAEIAGITAGHSALHDPYAAVLPAYATGLQCHALHDVSQYLIDNPLVQPPAVGCTAVAVWGHRSRDGHLCVGRIFDFEGGRCFDRDKVVYSVAPAQGHHFTTVAWGGMAGAVTGFNDVGLWVSLNAAASDDVRFAGRPMILVAREMLQDCATIDEAVAVLKAAPVFVTDAVMIASARDGRAVVVEKGPGGCAVREGEDDRLVVTNHFLSPAWSADRANARRLADGTTGARYARALALLDAAPVQDPASLLTLLRDRRGPAGEDVGFGNRGAINAWIAAHLVVADLTAGRMWVCAAPHGLGAATAFGVDGPLVDVAGLPADAEAPLARAEGGRLDALADDARAALRRGDAADARALSGQLLALNPQGFLANLLAGLAASDAGERRRLVARAAALDPPYAEDRREVAAALAGCR